MSANPDRTLDQSSPELRLAFEKFMQSGQKALSPRDREVLFTNFKKFLAAQKEQSAAR